VKKIILIFSFFLLYPISSSAGLFTSIEQDLIKELQNKNAKVEKVKEILNKGADPNYIDEEFGKTPLMTLVYSDNNLTIAETKNIMKMLLDKGANINAIQQKGFYKGYTVLMYAALLDNGQEIVKFLLEQGADPDIKSTGGYTALELAISKSNFSSARVLQKIIPDYTVDTLFKDFSENEIAAKKKYQNKFLDITGKISDIKEDDGTFVYMSNGEMIVRVYMSDDDVIKVKKGQNIKFRAIIYNIKDEFGVTTISFHVSELLKIDV
jgi:hypothetical protein